MMGCIWSKGIYLANEYVLKELYKFGQLLLCTLRRDDVMVASNAFLKMYNEQCLSQDQGSLLLTALGVSEFQKKHISEREEILKYIYRNWHYLQHDSSVTEALKETNFVRSGDKKSGQLYKPKDLFDPGDRLLISLFSGEVGKFPGERFSSYEWLNILRKTGLRDMGDADAVLECARRIEFLGSESMKQAGLLGDNNTTSNNKELCFTVWDLAKSLSQAIFQNFAVLYSHNFCNKLGKIACIPAKKRSPFKDETEDFKRVLCSYSEAILLKDYILAWSAAPILIGESLIPPEYSWEALQLRSPPPFTIILKHLQAEASSSTIENTFKILQHLDRIWSTLSSSDVSNLRKIQLIPVANRTYFVTTFFIFSRLTINLFPLAFELPSCYQPFLTILKEMGLREMLSLSSAMSILSEFYISIGGYQRLSPNELRAVMEILRFLYNEIIQHQNSDISNWESLLVVPDDSRRLVRPNSCVYIDAYGSRYVKHIDSSKLRFVHHDVSERMCVAFGIRKLSNVVVEELDCIEHLQTLEKVGSISLAAIRKKLLSFTFQVALSRVINAVSSSATRSENPNFQTLQRSLELVAQRLQFVQCIYTRFWLLPMYLDITQVSKDSIIPEQEIECGHRALCYVDRSNTCMLIGEPPKYVSVVDLVAVVVSHALGSPVPLPIGSLFLCPPDSETALVNHLKLSYDERVMDGFGSGAGFLGTDILPQDAMKVQLNPLRPFYKGEIVAWQSKSGEKLKYGRIPEDARPSGGQALYRINIETSPGKTEAIISSHVFWFKNFSFGYEYSTHGMSEKGNNVVRAALVKEPKGSRGVNLGNQGRSIEELKHGVSAAELIQAVEEMLASTGISMDTEKQCLLQRTLSLQERLKASQAALLLEQEKSTVGTSEAEKAKAPLLCRICLSNVIDITVVPCGHVLCHQCSLSVSHCPFCRVQLSEAIKMHRS